MLAVLGNDADAQARCRAIVDAPDGCRPRARRDGDQRGRRVRHARPTSTATSTASARAATPQEQLRYLYALGEFPDAELIRRACELAFSGEVKTQNAPFLLNRCIANREHGRLAWNIVRQRWTEANERFPGNTIVRMVDPVKLLNRPDEVADVQSFFSEHQIPQSAKTLDQILERQRVNAALREREQEPARRRARRG